MNCFPNTPSAPRLKLATPQSKTFWVAKPVLLLRWILKMRRTVRSHVMLYTPGPIWALKLSNTGQDSTWFWDCFVAPSTSSMGSDMDAAQNWGVGVKFGLPAGHINFLHRYSLTICIQHNQNHWKLKVIWKVVWLHNKRGLLRDQHKVNDTRLKSGKPQHSLNKFNLIRIK